MRLVIVESPFAAKTLQQGSIYRQYLRNVLRDCIMRGESPYASHAILPGALMDNLPEERRLGIEAGYAWWDHADLIAFYIDHGMSPGMEIAFERAVRHAHPYELRKL